MATDQLIVDLGGHLLTAIAIVVSACMAIRRIKENHYNALNQEKVKQEHWKKQKALEQQDRQAQLKYHTRIAAHKGVWRLVAYMGHTDNPKAMFEEYETPQGKNHYLYPERVEAFQVEIEKVFFMEGHGLFWTKEVKNAVFSYRRKVSALLHAKDKKTNEKGMIWVKPDLMKIFRKERENLMALVKEQLKVENLL